LYYKVLWSSKCQISFIYSTFLNRSYYAWSFVECYKVVKRT
jgi:hypothetical protein